MKTLFTTIVLTLLGINALMSQTEKFVQFNGKNREYLEYIPNVYNGSVAVPIILCLHGLGDTKENFFNIGMNYIADTANFILLFPEALDDTIMGTSTGTAWNSGASYSIYNLNPDIDDVGFLTYIIEQTKALYNIDESRIYVMGFSMGGFMTNRLACEMPGYFAAGVSISGTIGNSLNCNPEYPIPMCHMHGTNDQTVEYTNNLYGNDAEELVEYWRNYNQCDATPIITNLPDIAADGRTVTHYLYPNGFSNCSVEFYKINNGEHDWMYLPTYDISYSFEAWRFFRNKLNSNTSINKIENSQSIIIYPNPCSHTLNIEGKQPSDVVRIYNVKGQEILKSLENNIDVRALEKGIYFVKVRTLTQTIYFE
ncbi:MAG: T9SS type A sorting domain-containing protein [Bacteroidales bacterium]|nr:T9SS type A sorting domain-containing protein [Bacteroidales bacterium]